ncbi:RlpA-like double-psi beta-barrel domain-containing protein [Kitasatospora sp. NPDC096147]|uniref:RlpA-like double-psi beta-barrel domain-containing protein n=1 Tax=Kitasatospora sp. NPDC096147 TaxID=3364093 RepID=UPI00382AF1E6
MKSSTRTALTAGAGTLAFAAVFVAAAIPASAATYKGRATSYAPGLNECGTVDSPGDFIVAVSSQMFGNGSVCFSTVRITYNGRTATAKVTDRAPGAGVNDLDMSPALFKHFAGQGQNVLSGVSWSFTDSKPTPGGTTKAPTPKPNGTTKAPTPKPTKPTKPTKAPTPKPTRTTKAPTPNPTRTTKAPTPNPSSTAHGSALG